MHNPMHNSWIALATIRGRFESKDSLGIECPGVMSWCHLAQLIHWLLLERINVATPTTQSGGIERGGRHLLSSGRIPKIRGPVAWFGNAGQASDEFRWRASKVRGPAKIE